uniref:Uncharacterized protein n=1 Tax=Anguilla anguilla TaxID=7936 RepID=A0A0E9TXR6_ANGAN
MRRGKMVFQWQDRN